MFWVFGRAAEIFAYGRLEAVKGGDVGEGNGLCLRVSGLATTRKLNRCLRPEGLVVGMAKTRGLSMGRCHVKWSPAREPGLRRLETLSQGLLRCFGSGTEDRASLGFQAIPKASLTETAGWRAWTSSSRTNGYLDTSRLFCRNACECCKTGLCGIECR
jgi:hypothetical protein